MEEIRSKWCNTSDIEELVRIRLVYLSEVYGGLEKLGNIAENTVKFFEDELNKTCFAVMALQNGKAVSCAILDKNKRAPTRDLPNGKYGEVRGVYTMTNYRKQGLCGKLIEMLIAKSIELELSGIYLGASDMGISTYKKCGFVLDETDYTHMYCDLADRK